MSQTGDERLLVLVEARITDLERNMKKASGTTGREFGKMRKDAKSATRDMEQDVIRSTSRINQALAGSSTQIGAFGRSFAGLGKGALAGIGVGIAGLGLSELISQARESAKEVANIGSEAERAGVSAKAFQELGYVAQQNRIPIDALTDGLKELALRADELIQTGSGPAAESFHRLGLTADELKEKLKNPQELMIEIIDKLGKLDKASQIRIADELFGGSAGERFVELIDTGADGIRDLIKEANSFGLVMDDEMIAKAAEVDRLFNLMSNTVGVVLKTAILNAANALGQFIDQFRAVENQQASTIKKTLEINLDDQTAKLAEIQDIQEQSDRDPGMSNLYRQQLELRNSELAKLRDDYGRLNATLQTKTPPPPAASPAPVSTLNSKPFKVPKEKKKKAERDDEYEREVKQIEEQTTALQAETAAQAQLNPLIDDYGFKVKRVQAAMDLYTAAKEAGTAAGKELSSVTQLLDADFSGLSAEAKEQAGAMLDLANGFAAATAESQKLKESQERAREAAEDMRDLGKDVLGGFIDDMRNGVNVADALESALGRIADKLIDMSLESLFDPKGGAGGGLFGAIGSLFGGFKAAGGPVSGSKVYAVGEKGPELFAPGQSGTIIPNHALGMPGAGPAAASQTNIAPVINIAGASIVIQGDANQETIGRMEAMMKARDKDLPNQVVAAFQDAKRRGRIR